jgi:hypothetical protein
LKGGKPDRKTEVHIYFMPSWRANREGGRGAVFFLFDKEMVGHFIHSFLQQTIFKLPKRTLIGLGIVLPGYDICFTNL